MQQPELQKSCYNFQNTKTLPIQIFAKKQIATLIWSCNLFLQSVKTNFMSRDSR